MKSTHLKEFTNMDKKKISVLSVSALNIMTNASIAPMLVYLSRAFPEVSMTNIRMMLTLPALVIIFSSLLTGILANKLPKRTLLFSGLILYMIGGIGAAFCNQFSTILVFRIILGLGAGVTNTFSTALISSFYDGEERVKLIGNSTVVSHAVAVISPLLTGWLASFSWRYAFGIYGIALIVLLITFFWLPEPPAAAPAQQSSFKPGLTKMGTIIAVNAGLLMVTFYIFPTGIAHLIDARGIGNSQAAGFAASISTMASTLINLFFAKLMRFFKRYVWVFSITLMVAGFALMAFSTTVFLTYLGVFLSGCGMGILFPGIMLRATQYASPNNTARTISMVVAGSNLGQFLSPFLYSFLQRWNSGGIPILYDFQTATVLFGIALLVSIVLLIFPTSGQRESSNPT
ncbi:MAG TPA: hypothetical protein DCK95_10990 [Anaerolineaceae bacterium]|uniref:Putative major facilitator superfamily protein n=1 Tax=Anaerolinea thermophila TaxID=167964 RepID=A0A101FXS8_9CHLR|nr:MAG: Putative major facilitator superfamily protein [Anaerolinea thermophila]HAF62832.1 hypothetical protein [Anaerolineaceae bacterium]